MSVLVVFLVVCWGIDESVADTFFTGRWDCVLFWIFYCRSRQLCSWCFYLLVWGLTGLLLTCFVGHRQLTAFTVRCFGRALVYCIAAAAVVFTTFICRVTVVTSVADDG